MNHLSTIAIVFKQFFLEIKDLKKILPPRGHALSAQLLWHEL